MWFIGKLNEVLHYLFFVDSFNNDFIIIINVKLCIFQLFLIIDNEVSLRHNILDVRQSSFEKLNPSYYCHCMDLSSGPSVESSLDIVRLLID